MGDLNYSSEVSVIDVNDNSTGLAFRPGFVVPSMKLPPFWISVTNGVLSTGSLLSQAIVILIAKGLEGDYSAKTLMWVQAIFECLKRLFSVLMAFQKQIRKYNYAHLPNSS